METQNTEGSLYIKSENGIASITFAHPLSNSLPGNLLARIAQAFIDLGNDKETKVILFQSEGDRAFCAGAALNELVAIENKEDGETFFMGFAKVINAMRTCGKFIVGRVQGKAVGGGVGLIGACDYIFATENASSQLSIDATHWQNAYWAKDKGLYSQVFENIEDLDKSLNELLEKLASYNPESMSALKKSFWKGTENWDQLLAERAKLSGTLVLSSETQKALQKFKK